ncbi:Superoxide dismutase [Fe] [Planctomycetaceae bacterium]|nr:Superoxide dismutase [Fe] [Planctomycetaceae bacterium]
MDNTRRDALKGMLGGSAALVAMAAAGGNVLAQEEKPAAPAGGSEAGRHEVMPLPFDAAKLRGISQQMISNHHGKNYAGAVKNLNKAEADLAALGKDASPYLVAGLRRAELTFTNSVIYHEHYFNNLGGDGKMTGRVEKLVSELWGSKGKWEESFINTGLSLGGGSGWTALAYNFHTGELRNYWSDNHTTALAYGKPLLVLDMFEHAYQLDYGPNHAKYVEAFFENINWEEVNKRLEKAEAIAKLLKA